MPSKGTIKRQNAMRQERIAKKASMSVDKNVLIPAGPAPPFPTFNEHLNTVLGFENNKLVANNKYPAVTGNTIIPSNYNIIKSQMKRFGNTTTQNNSLKPSKSLAPKASGMTANAPEWRPRRHIAEHVVESVLQNEPANIRKTRKNRKASRKNRKARKASRKN